MVAADIVTDPAVLFGVIVLDDVGVAANNVRQNRADWATSSTARAPAGASSLSPVVPASGLRKGAMGIWKFLRNLNPVNPQLVAFGGLEPCN